MLKLPRLIYANKFALPPLPPAGAFNGQTILITGGTSGLGLAAAVHFLNLGASRVMITGRTLAKGLSAKSSIESQVCIQNPGKVDVRLLDMSTFAAIEEFAESVKLEVKSIDYVLLNAGVMAKSFRMTEEGYEETVFVNCLGTTLLALLLLPWLKVAGNGKAHLGIVSSGLHKAGVNISHERWPPQDIFAELSKKENWTTYGSNMYAISKLLLQYCINEIAKLSTGTDGTLQVIVNSISPGMVKSGLSRDHRTSVLMGVLVDVFSHVAMKSTEGGARTLVRAALTTKEQNGENFADYQSHDEYKQAVQHNVLGPEGTVMQAQVWREALKIFEEKLPNVRQIIEPAVGQ